MTDTVKARELAWDLIGRHLRECVTPRFDVQGGELERLPATGRPVLNYWFGGETEKEMTLGNVMSEVQVQVRAYWRVPSNEVESNRLQVELWHATRGLQAPLSADRTLGGNVTALFIGPARPGELMLGQGGEEVEVRTLEFELVLQELEAEEVAI